VELFLHNPEASGKRKDAAFGFTSSSWMLLCKLQFHAMLCDKVCARNQA